MDEETVKVTEVSSSSKQSRAEDEERSSVVRKLPVSDNKSELLTMSNPGSWSGFGDKKEKLKINEGDITITEGPDGLTMMNISTDLQKRLCKPWENALILKIMGRVHTLNFMKNKLKQKWPLIVGQWQLIDLDDGHFVARFQMKEDRDFVLTGGPWVIANHFLVVEKWRPKFVPGDEPIGNMAIWVRLYGLPMEWMVPDRLWHIGGMLGTTCKVDPVTVTQVRGRFTRICVEVDISKPIVRSLRVDGRSIRVEYEQQNGAPIREFR
ncbi:hypothetical protein ACOSQ4_020014 [Xanthoceras sorbifolium]